MHLAVRRLEVLDLSKAGGSVEGACRSGARHVGPMCGPARVYVAYVRSCPAGDEPVSPGRARIERSGCRLESRSRIRPRVRSERHGKQEACGSRECPTPWVARHAAGSSRSDNKPLMQQNWRRGNGIRRPHAGLGPSHGRCAELSRHCPRGGRDAFRLSHQFAASPRARRGAGASTFMRTRIDPSVVR